MDRVRAAIFSSLGDLVPGADVLDLFAGSGAFGIEALSRGANSLVSVDHAAASTRCIRSNLRRCGLQASVQQMDAANFLGRFAAPVSYDLIFADPPYRKCETDADPLPPLLASPHLLASLREGGLFILEAIETAAPPREDGPWEIARDKIYGGTRVFFLRPR